MNSTLILPSPCKINLFLRITGQRPDGYHELQTLFQLLDYGDTLYFTKAHEITVATPLPGIKQSANLIYKAAMALKEKTGYCHGAQIKIDKVLPMGGGLGGGSSNAATTLLALNRLWSAGLTINQLAEIGLSLGADVPVFVHGRSAWGEGIGEQLTPVSLGPHWYLVIRPDCEINTGEIFSNKRLTRDSPKLTIAPALDGEIQNLGNDCEAIVAETYAEVAKGLNWLGQFGRARLTGTGACIFADFQSKAAALEVLRNCPEHWSGFVAQGIDRSSLHKELNLKDSP
ncbi:MAG: 4-(cytidine 5'-diphospho)-2-C-methyl-D-erythritol kinase [Gammaproteobacteria bacterium]|nr:MAG: 4-(cytidine 5'-diphospho)-2-C-methyl-D-erythritol kinase [Gammaproteobacteria bacterium]